MSKWAALHIVMGCLTALLALWMLRDYKSPWLTRAFQTAMALLFGWISARSFAGGWESGQLRMGCRGCAWRYRDILFDQNAIEFVFAMGVYACVFVIALGYLLYLGWWLLLIVLARFR